MKTGKQIAAQLNALKGPIFVAVSNFDDVFYIQAVKSDLVRAMRDLGDAASGFEINTRPHGHYFDKDYSAA